MDEKFFSITNKDALKAALIKNKSYIITRLNNDFQKPYCQCEHRETTRSGVMDSECGHAVCCCPRRAQLIRMTHSFFFFVFAFFSLSVSRSQEGRSCG